VGHSPSKKKSRAKARGKRSYPSKLDKLNGKTNTELAAKIQSLQTRITELINSITKLGASSPKTNKPDKDPSKPRLISKVQGLQKVITRLIQTIVNLKAIGRNPAKNTQKKDIKNLNKTLSPNLISNRPDHPNLIANKITLITSNNV
jgi:hypothetical protein